MDASLLAAFSVNGRWLGYIILHIVFGWRQLFPGKIGQYSQTAIKPFVTGRKNWLFMGNADGAEAAATIFSLVETCRHHGLDPYSYFKYVLTHIRDAETMEQLEQLLPYYVERQALLNQYRVTDVQ